MLLKIVDGVVARGWLAQLLSQISFCNDKGQRAKLNIAFTYAGLEKLLAADELQGFSREFCEGMVTPHRQRVLGDLSGSPSDPRNWKWGAPDGDAIDVLLLVYEVNTSALEDRLAGIRKLLGGVAPIIELRSTALLEDKEHFGFRDGISQPWVVGLHRSGHERDRIAAGELVLGYDDNTGVPEPAPKLATNGSYLVLRQIVQRVPEFWDAFPDVPAEEKLRLAAWKMGRWPDGTSLVLSPHKPDPDLPLNDFSFAETDPDGLRCPFGSHIRRANPRDALLPNPKQSQESVNRHRILRRGRAFGLPAAPEAFPGDLQVRCDDDAIGDRDARGLFFICLNASLSRQFEFCQQSWLDNPKFVTLSDETDPIASAVQWSGPDQEPVLTRQACPVRYRVPEREKYVHTIGGGYFFLPARTALLRLSAAQGNAADH
jgi:Dyp-type peroxidase family